LMINSEIENLIQSLVYDFHARMIQNQIFKLLKRGSCSSFTGCQQIQDGEHIHRAAL